MVPLLPYDVGGVISISAMLTCCVAIDALKEKIYSTPSTTEQNNKGMSKYSVDVGHPLESHNVRTFRYHF